LSVDNTWKDLRENILMITGVYQTEPQFQTSGYWKHDKWHDRTYAEASEDESRYRDKFGDPEALTFRTNFALRPMRISM
jgi:hypothetical protein